MSPYSGLAYDFFLKLNVNKTTYDIPRGVCISASGMESLVQAFHINWYIRGSPKEIVEDGCDGLCEMAWVDCF